MGYCFCSSYIDHSTTVIPETIKWIANQRQFADIILFDLFIYNADRNEGNLLVTIKPNHHLYAIDYSHIFVDGEWNRYLLQELMKEDITTDHTIMVCNRSTYQMFIPALNLCYDDFLQIIDNKYSKLSRDVFYDIMSNTPERWRPCKEDCDMLVQYLECRMDNIRDIAKQIII